VHSVVVVVDIEVVLDLHLLDLNWMNFEMIVFGFDL
jgi:hypothetical protein